MDKYGQLPSNFGTMNEAQQNDAVRAAGYSGLSDYRDNANKIAQGNTLGQTNAEISAPAIQAPVNVPYSTDPTGQFVGSLASQVNVSAKAVSDLLAKQKAENEAKLAALRTKEAETLTKVGEISTPFREDLEKTERERLYINENFEANQKLTSELDTLLTEGNELIKQQKEVTGLSAIRNPRIQKTMDDVASRAGVIQAVISARNGQISVAENMIDRSIGAITADRQERLNYYSTILNLNSRDIVSLDSEQKQIAQQEVATAQKFLDSAIKNADYLKQLLVNPATAALMGEAGVKITDTPEQISAKLSQASYKKEVSDLNNKMTIAGNTQVFDPSTVSASQLVTVSDSKGNKYYYKKEEKPLSTTQTTDTYLKKISDTISGRSTPTTTTTKSTSTVNYGLQSPQFSPTKGVGTVYQDPKTGIFWKYTKSGWQLM